MKFITIASCRAAALLSLVAGSLFSPQAAPAQSAGVYYITNDAVRKIQAAYARTNGHLVLLVAHSTNCGACDELLSNMTVTNPPVRQTIQEIYDFWHCRMDPPQDTGYQIYVKDLTGGYPLPLTCLIDPAKPDTYMNRYFGSYPPSAILGLLRAAPMHLVRPEATNLSPVLPSELPAITNLNYVVQGQFYYYWTNVNKQRIRVAWTNLPQAASYCKLNNGAWTNGVKASSTVWTAPLGRWPGLLATTTNTLSVYILGANSAKSMTNSISFIYDPSPPKITTPPVDRTTGIGGTATFSVGAGGTIPLRYQWIKNGTNYLKNAGNLTGATTDTLTITNVALADLGSYSVLVKNPSGYPVLSSSAVLTVLVRPVAVAITTQPQSQTNVVGTSVSFTVAATGTAPLSYQWRFNGMPIDGATANLYSLPSVQSANAGTYDVLVTNVVNALPSQPATLTVWVPPRIAVQPQSQSVRPGITVTFSVGAAGIPPVTYRWRRNEVSVSGATNASYSISNAQTNQAGIYTVAVSNQCGSVISSNAVLTVDGQKPTITITSPTANQRWSNAVFTVTGTARDNAGVAAVWCRFNGGVWTNASSPNGWTNWTTTVRLMPGTNTLKTFALDAAGNKSATNSVSFFYVVPNQLRIQATGQGTLSPNYSNNWLEIGRSYTNTAAGINGHAFTNWVISTNWGGGLTNTSAVLRFLMQSNLTLRVNFADVTRPTNTITAPTANQRVTNAVFTVMGTARDNARVAAVCYQFNSNAWATAASTNGWTNWWATGGLPAGTNLVRAYAVDTSGNKSTTNSVRFVTANAFKLRLNPDPAQPLATNGFRLRLDASSGLPGRIQVSTNLVDWSPLANFVGTNVPVTFRDPAATNHTRRFYRAVTP